MISSKIETFLYTFFSGRMLASLIALLLAGFILASVILLFHWNKYGVNKRTVLTAEVLYFFVAIGLIIFTITSATLFYSS